MVLTGKDEEFPYSLVENSIERLELHSHEWEERFGLAASTHEPCPFPGSLAKACLEPPTSRKSFVSSLTKWFQKVARKNGSSMRLLATKEHEPPSSVLDRFVCSTQQGNKLEPDGVSTGNDEEGPFCSDQMGCALLSHRDQLHSVVLANKETGGLLQGEVHCECPQSLAPKVGILRCAAALYHQIWYFRTVQAKDVLEAFGFATSSYSHRSKTILCVTLLKLEKPKRGPIGAKYPLWEYTRTFDVSTGTGPALDELSQFVVSVHPMDSPGLPLLQQSPGNLLLPELSWQTFQTRKYKVMPTITGSLVVKCQSSATVKELLAFEAQSEDSCELEGAVTALDALVPNDENGHDHIWFVKFKTPPFGMFWDTARLAINGSRGMHRLGGNGKPRFRDISAIQRWAFLYPMDSILGRSRSITIMRSAGVAFKGVAQLEWEAFKVEFYGLVKSTLGIQTFFNSLVHGDINEGNMLFDGNMDDHQKLFFIDWDEALRPKPCFRKISSAEESLRYPQNLIDFPVLYTKQQLLHLFKTVVLRYYSAAFECNESFLTLLKGQGLFLPSGVEPNSSFLRKAAVEERFKTMLDGLYIN